MTTTLVSDRGASARRHYRVPWSPHAWSQALYLAGGVPAQLAAPFIVLAPLFAVHPRPAAALLAGLVLVFLVFLAVPAFTGIQRQRLRATAGVAIPPQPAIEHRLSRPGIVLAGRSPATSRTSWASRWTPTRPPAGSRCWSPRPG